MKTLKKIGFLFLMTAAAGFLFSSCTDNGGDPAGPKLTLDPDFTFDDRDATPGENIRIDVVITSVEKLADLTMVVTNGANEDQVYLLENIGEKSYSGSISRAANSTVTAVETWTIMITDNKGNSDSKSIEITTVGESPALVESANLEFYNFKGANAGAFDLVSEEALLSAAADTKKDLFDQTTTGGTFSKKWGTLNGAEFIMNPPGVTYQAFSLKKYSDLEAAWTSNLATKVSVTPELAEGDLLLVKSGQSGKKVFLVRINTITDDGSSANNDSYNFDILKAAI
jgi:hypothetical protein